MNKLFKTILPDSTIGIIGGGQLGRMMALSARAMGYKIAVLDPTPNSPCGQIADIEITASFDDLQAIQKLANVSDVITYEFENIDFHTLAWLEENTYLPQGSHVLKMTQHRGVEKKMIQEAGLDVAPFQIISTKEDLKRAIETIGIPSVLKTCRFGYDGKGQFVIRQIEDIEIAAELLQSGDCILEKWLPFQKEISVIVTRSVNGEVKTLPVAENIHVNNILHQSIVPARISPELQQKAMEAAMSLIRHLDVIGTLAIEMFVVGEENIFINELAPRPHNSGHFSIDACETSQFEQHVRAICGLPLGETNLWKPVVMVNLLGEHVEHALDKIQLYHDVKLHLYGKKERKEKRKMGHVNVLADTMDLALQKAEKITTWYKEEVEALR